MVVASDSTRFATYPRLDIEQFHSKYSLSKALVSQAAANPEEYYFLHGQFNYALWLALLMGKMKPSHVSWHVWGADLYEDSPLLRHQLFYILRRRAQGRIGHLFSTRGDLSFYRQRHPSVPASLLYFPTLLGDGLEQMRQACDTSRPFTLLVGNSGDPSNRHIEALRAIHRQFGSSIRVVLPMGYPSSNEDYIAKVRVEGKRYFPDANLHLLPEPLAFNDYLTLLCDCDAGYFIFQRQQGIGTLCLLIQLGLPFVLSKENPFWQDLVEQQVPVLFDSDLLSVKVLRNAQHLLLALDPGQLEFFYPNILKGWRQALPIALGARV
ncbi:4-alpha-L-fucosyltransferase [Candidatus Palibaumannia cicadellinicola]|uniref:4-alpha-L-fucosyltransferase n=2 Tax=Candidatus Palibaumannia cicadellinicola TaxID=186490 RepID=A0A088N165_9GAMM|nr:4-alpha-L-fucosyltransferase [Candidatus Baumannia cicadellinicola]